MGLNKVNLPQTHTIEVEQHLYIVNEFKQMAPANAVDHHFDILMNLNKRESYTDS